MEKYGDMINGFGYLGVVKSVKIFKDGGNFALVQSVVGIRCTRVYLIPPVWEENKLPKIDDRLLVGGLVQIENISAFSSTHDIAGKAIFCAKMSPGYISEVQSWKKDNPFAVVESSKYGKVRLPLSAPVWFEKRFPEKNDNVIVCGITSVDGEKVAGGGIFVRC